MISVYFYGNLREFGKRFDLHAQSSSEALHALFVQISGLREKMRDGWYQVHLNGRRVHDVNDLHHQTDGVLHITPKIQGAGKAGQLIAGVVLIVVGAVLTYTGVGGGIGVPMMKMGATLAIGGVAQMLTKTPNLNVNSKGVEQSRNSSFSNLDNTAAQGQPVPLAYGLVYCGSRVISQGVETRRIATDGKAPTSNPTAQDLTVRLEKIYTTGVAAVAPNGQTYQTDFNHESVRNHNYIVRMM